MNNENTYILLVEDDNEINRMENDLLSSYGYNVISAFSGTEALLLLKQNEFSLIILDLMLPGMSGEEVLYKIRQESLVPVICVSAKDDIKTRVELIHNGADDYIVKPFDNNELLVRIEALLRRNNTQASSLNKILKFKDIEMNVDNHEVSVKGKNITLTKREYAILELLMSNPKKVFSKNNIFESVWNEYYLAEDNAVNVHISNIRFKLSQKNSQEKYISTVWGIGFKMNID